MRSLTDLYPITLVHLGLSVAGMLLKKELGMWVSNQHTCDGSKTTLGEPRNTRPCRGSSQHALASRKQENIEHGDNVVSRR